MLVGDQVRVERLRSFGLSTYGIRAYLALLELGTSSARDISRHAKIPVAKVYSVLEQLQTKGLARILPEKPRRYEPVAIVDFLQTLRRRHEQSIVELNRAEAEMNQLYPIVGNVAVGDRGSVNALRGRRAAYERIESALAKARRDVLYAPSTTWSQRTARIASLMKLAHQHGARVRFLPPRNHTAPRELAGLPGVVETRVRDPLPNEPTAVSVLLIDGERIFLHHHVPDDASADSPTDYCLDVREETIVRALQSYVEARWELAARQVA